MRQAIETKYLPWTNTKPMRVKAYCQAGSLTLEWDDGLSANGNHIRAARALADKLGWEEPFSGGWLKNSHAVFVFEEKLG